MGLIGKAAPLSYAQTVKRLAAAHRRRDKGIVAIYSFPDSHEHQVRLVEVTRSVPFDRPLLPFQFSPRAEIRFPSTLILVHPKDWARVRAREVQLPGGWDLDAARSVVAPKKRPA